ncbi:prolipoprotein diacylglyceryl transferase [Pedobacter arcticus]|uniref:prolipoprotein diacylglyceryl transferase n=1 Tax=Pedobacter arcticus TaxID=752140 RepID=UPI0002DF5250|nr:prolipoprotein diacylglyceryl transferase family protein [Pedobacter arcticus]
MFPTLSSLTEYLFGFSFNFPIYTFGVFVALAFIFPYFIFQSEFERKEKEGYIKPFLKTTVVSLFSLYSNILLRGFLGFFIGFKLVGVIFNYALFKYNPAGFIFSLEGSWLGGLSFLIIALIITYFSTKSESVPQPKVLVEEVHPYQLMPTLIVWAAFCGFIGSKLFSLIERFPQFIDNPWHELTTFTGLTFYGGFIFGAIAYLVIGYRNGMKLIHLADIGSPGMLVAYGVGRIGCQLSGDGDWGIVNNNPKPEFLSTLPDWMWSFKFPHNVLNEGQYILGCYGEHCMILPQGVYPTSFYETVIILTAFLILWLSRKQMKVPGTMFTLFLIVNGLERFFIEFIRVNPKHIFLGMFITQAQIIALIFIVGGVLGLAIIIFKGNRTGDYLHDVAVIEEKNKE